MSTRPEIDWYCPDCEAFVEPDVGTERDYCEFWGQPVYHEYAIYRCPACQCEALDELARCPDCHDAPIDGDDYCLACEAAREREAERLTNVLLEIAAAPAIVAGARA